MVQLSSKRRLRDRGGLDGDIATIAYDRAENGVVFVVLTIFLSRGGSELGKMVGVKERKGLGGRAKGKRSE